MTYDPFTLPSPLPALLPGAALWALCLYVPLSRPLARLEEVLKEGQLGSVAQQAVLVLSSLLLSLAVGLVTELLLSWALGPGWATSLGLIAVIAAVFLGLAALRNEDP